MKSLSHKTDLKIILHFFLIYFLCIFFSDRDFENKHVSSEIVSGQAYNKLLHISREMTYLDSAIILCDWDQNLMMPREGTEARAKILAYLSDLRNKIIIDSQFGILLKSAEKESDWSPIKAANLRLWKRDYYKRTKLPEGFVARESELAILSQAAWEKAREKNDYAIFKPYLNALVNLYKEKSKHIGYKNHPYDVLLDDKMPGMTVERCDKLFNEIKPKIIEFIKKLKKSSIFSSPNPFQGTIYPKTKQEEFLREITETLGYSYESGLLNETKRHPQTDAIAFGDVRICTRYSQNDPLIGIFSGIHEAGHGINLQGVPKDYYGMPVFNSPGLDMDEAQSRFFENHIGRSKAFWQYYFPTFKEKFSPASDNISLDDLYRYANRINLCPIRLEADEVSYVLHIIIRYEIERDLFGNIINTENLPNIWMQKHEDYLGVQVPDDRSGILQDIHWAAGLFGYFPSYVLGSLNAAQLDAAMRRDYPDLDQHLASGDLNIMASWMKDHIYKYGSIHEVPELMKLASGKDTDFTDFLIYLGNKYR